MEDEDIDGLTNDLDSKDSNEELNRTTRWC
jgi:hypothetical protein